MTDMEKEALCLLAKPMEKSRNFVNNGNNLQKQSIYYRKMNKMWLEKENGSI